MNRVIILTLLLLVAAVVVINAKECMNVDAKKETDKVKCDFWDTCCKAANKTEGNKWALGTEGCCRDWWIIGGISGGAAVVIIIICCAVCICCMSRK
jgi:hypothetical protein